MKISILVVLLSAFAFPAFAELRLPGFFTDHLVLQRQIPIPVWGWADPGKEVSVRIGENETVMVKANAEGKWKVKLPEMEAGGPFELTVVEGETTLTVRDILIGEVWLCSGQSNMEWSVANSLDPAKEAAAANYPEIRHVKIGKVTSGSPKDDVAAEWQVCRPETVSGFTATGYYMARELHKQLGVPIGLLNSSWGGTRIEPWTPIEGFAEVESLNAIHRRLLATMPESDEYRTTLQKHIDATEDWLATAKSALANGDTVSKAPEFPATILPIIGRGEPAAIYNAMMAPLVGYGMRGAVWYQGESNHGEGMLYHEKKKALVGGWRKLWEIGDFPFYYVQIAPYQYGKENPTILPRFWEAQTTSLEIPNTGMVVTNDIGNISDIHPKNKQEVGRRLALLALRNDYGKDDLAASGPVFESMEIEGEKIRIHFTHATDGLKTRDGQPPSHFQVIGEHAEWIDASAEIEGDSVLLHSPEVKEPAAMRYAWDKLAEPNLQNGAGLPASAFRAGTIPEYDYLGLAVAESKEYKLVYDLDLKKLASKINYTTDRSQEISAPFDRVAYFMELHQAGGEVVYSYVSMDAFTDDLSKIGVPTADSETVFQKGLTNLKIISNTDAVSSGENVAGNIEFWPNNYGPKNQAKVVGGLDQIYDIGDEMAAPVAGYGSMQIHHTQKKQTIFAINYWKAGDDADLGIGNSTSEARDWTFVHNAASFEKARLRILVRLKP